MTEIIINGTEDLPRAARVFLEHIGTHRILAFYGAMGAGKTTFITAVCRALGVQDDDIRAAIADSIRVSEAAYKGTVKLLDMKGE